MSNEQATEQTTNDQLDEQGLAIAAITAGFEGRDTETPPEPESTAMETEPKSEETTPEHVPITRDQFDRFMAVVESFEALKTTAERNASTAFGKIGGLERRMNELSARALQIPKDKVERLKSELPEIAEIFEAIQVSSPAFDEESLVSKVHERLKPDDILSQAEDRAWRRLAEARATELHEDWREVSRSEGFSRFVKDKGDAYASKLAEAADKWDYVTVCRAIGEFKKQEADAATRAASQRSRMDAAITPRSTSAPPAARKTDIDHLMAGFKEG